MKTYKKIINNLTMTGYNDSGASWVISSVDQDGYKRTVHYDRIINGKVCTLKSVFELHADLFS